jgi:hypothetical protein
MHSGSAKLRFLRFQFHNTDTGLKYPVPIYLEKKCSIKKGEKRWQMRGEEGRRQVGQTQHQSPQVPRLIPATENKI